MTKLDKKTLEKVKVEAFIIWYGNQDMKGKAILTRLAEKGLSVGRNTLDSWLRFWRKGKDLPQIPKERMAEIPHVASVPMPKAPEGALTVEERLTEQMEGRVPRARKLGTKVGEVKVVAGEEGGVTHEMGVPVEPKAMPAITWQDILNAVPDNRRLALLLADGMTARVVELRLERDGYKELYEEAQKEIGELREKIETLMTDREQLLRELDGRIKQLKEAGLFTVEERRHAFIAEPGKKASPTASGGEPEEGQPPTTASADQE